MKKTLCGLVVSIGLLTPLVTMAQDHDAHNRYYDASHKDYHEWNSGEDAAFHSWLKENHRKDHDWAHANKKEQQAYWAWRHDHPDAR